MSETNTIEAGGPFTRATIAEDLRRLGLASGATVIVHSSLSRLGWVAGGAHAVVLALLEVVGPAGTIVMPTHTGLSDPARWRNPPVPEAWWPVFRAEVPAYDDRLTPTRNMGAIVECFRHLEEVARSGHPAVSVAAVGPHRDEVVSSHSLADSLGESSPLARLYELDAYVLLLGVGHANNTSLHLAEYRAAFPKTAITQGAPVRIGQARSWVEWLDIDHDSSDFEALGTAFAATGGDTEGTVGSGTARLMRQRAVVDFAVSWMGEHR
jgi:aminoglycoside 3-N-acetyltransferase